jgi:hypothetical protein
MKQPTPFNLHRSVVYPLQVDPTRDVSHGGLVIYIQKYMLRQRKNHGNSNISPMQKPTIVPWPFQHTSIENIN